MAEQLTDASELDAALSASQFLILKHSQICPTSAKAFSEYESFANVFDDVPNAWIDVIEHRALSDALASATGVKHESPQALFLRDGQAVWHASHFSVTQRALADAWASCFDA